MLWRIQFDDGALGWVESSTGRVFADGGEAITHGVSYTTTDTAPQQPAWYSETPPPPPPPPPITWTDPLPPEYYWIDVGPFFDRFGAKALTITSSANDTVRGLVTLILPRKYIDLKRADLPMMVGVLRQLGLITQEEQDQALALTTTESERHIKGLQQPSE